MAVKTGPIDMVLDIIKIIAIIIIGYVIIKAIFSLA